MANITYIRIDDEVYALHDDNALTSDSNLDASKVVGTLPANTYTNTTYESKAAVEGGTDISLVTTGDKYRWNNASGGGVSDVEVNGSSVVSGGVAEITVPTKTSDLTNDSNFQNATQVDTAINSRIASVYKAKGSIAFLDLPALTSSNEGFVYDINESFTTTSDFVEGAGVTYPAGTNVVIIDTGSGVYKYDVLAGLVDLSGKQDLLVSGTNIKTINGSSVLGSGNLTVSGGLQNLVDGSATGSVRGVNTATEGSSYTMGDNAVAEGYNTKASGSNAHAEGSRTTASGSYSHVEGYLTSASGRASHAEGERTTASGSYSHAQNDSTIAAKNAQTAIGKYNIEDTETDSSKQKALIIGNGSEKNRSNALTVDWQGNVNIASGASYKINGTALSASDVGAQPTLVSGTNIKTINSQSLLGSGNLDLLGLVQKHESTYTTTGSSESTIPIGISGLRSTDVLFVDINGLDLIQGTDYTVSGTNIVLTTPITTTGTKVHFVAIRMAEVTVQDYANLKGDKGDKGDPGEVDVLAGAIQMYAGATEPEGWKFCNGQTLKKSDYSELFAAIGTTYNDGTEESTDFKLPDLQNRFPVGAGAAYDLNDKGGQATVTLNIDQIPSHDHAINGTYYKRETGSYDSYGYINKNGGDHTGYSADRGGGQAHENMPPYIGINFIICTGK